MKHINNIPIIVKLCSIVSVLDSDCKFSDDLKIQLKKLIKREADKEDGDQSYQDMLFEFSMTSRFLENLDNHNIDLSTDCDLIINNSIAVECKYIHGKNKLEDNIKKARKQIYRRVDDGLAEIGIIAVDLSNLINSDDINGIIAVDKKEMLSKFEDYYYKNIIERLSIEIKNIDKNKIFGNSKIIHVILLQSFNFALIDFKDSLTPFISRVMHPIYNPRLSEEDRLKIGRIIKSLEVGY